MPEPLLLLLQMRFMHLIHRARNLIHRRLDLLQQIRPRIALLMINQRLVRDLGPNVVNDQVRQLSVQPDDAVLHLLGLGERPQSRPRETEGHGAQDHGFAPVRAHPRGVAAPARALVHDDEVVGHVAEDVEQGVEGLDADGVDAFWGRGCQSG